MTAKTSKVKTIALRIRKSMLWPLCLLLQMVKCQFMKEEISNWLPPMSGQYYQDRPCN